MTFLLDLLVDVGILVRRNKGLVLIGVVRDVRVNRLINIERAGPILFLKGALVVVVYVVTLASAIR